MLMSPGMQLAHEGNLFCTTEGSGLEVDTAAGLPAHALPNPSTRPGPQSQYNTENPDTTYVSASSPSTHALPNPPSYNSTQPVTSSLGSRTYNLYTDSVCVLSRVECLASLWDSRIAHVLLL